MFVRHLIVTLIGVVAFTALAACDTVKAPATLRTDPLGGAYPQNVALEGLHKYVVVDQPIVDGPTDTRPLQVSVPLRSIIDGFIHLQYRFELLDGRGRPLRSSSGFKYITIEPRTQVFLESNALDTNAVDWRLTVRKAR
jgi:hypothetical protein